MSRPFEFNDTVKSHVRLRQSVNGKARCAVCSIDLDDEYEEAHHVVPNQSGNINNRGHYWLKMAENCVIICDTCHHRVHENGRTRYGSVAPPDYFPFSHGNNIAAHRQWVKNLNARIEDMWS